MSGGGMERVIGSGAIAARFADYNFQQSVCIFAGNIHCSTISDRALTDAEEELLKNALEQSRDKKVVYFSSCSILAPDAANTLYVQHKLRMEELVRSNASNYLIARLPRIVGFDEEPTSLLNYLVHSISAGEQFELWNNAIVNIIDMDDVHDIFSRAIQQAEFNNTTINVASSFDVAMPELVNIIETVLHNEAKCIECCQGSAYPIDVEPIRQIVDELGISFDRRYLERIFTKYFSPDASNSRLLSIIVPTYNEEFGIQEFYRRTHAVLMSLRPRFHYEMIFVNDFSTDNTGRELEKLARQDPKVKILSFSRNFGNQMAITAGIDYCKGDCVVIIDDDLQDPPEIILNMLSKWYKGYKVVYGVRPQRQGVNPLFKLIAKVYYRIIRLLSETRIPTDTGDFRLIDKAVVTQLKKLREENRYYRGLVAWIGFRQAAVYYERDRRYAGVSTFSWSKYFKFAVSGLTSFTSRPLYIACIVGLAFTALSFVLALFFALERIIDPNFSVPGWTSLVVTALFLGGLQLLCTGISSVYVSKIYNEVKGRPLYIIEDSQNITPD